jgi:hypothetical protein
MATNVNELVAGPFEMIDQFRLEAKACVISSYHQFHLGLLVVGERSLWFGRMK